MQVLSTIPSGFVEGPHRQHAHILWGDAISGYPDPESGIRNLTEHLGPIAHMRQIHGDRVAYANQAGLYEEYDALITDISGLWLCVKTADCVPVIVTTPYAVAVVHCGWRGLEQEILSEVIQIITDEFRMDSHDVQIAIGPHINFKKYEVGEEFKDVFASKFFGKNRDGKRILNMAGIVESQAKEVGVSLENIWQDKRCTFEDKNLNSYRRAKQCTDKGNSGRNLSLVCLTGG